MATSDSRDFTLDVAEIVEEAYERLGKEAMSGYDLQRARRSLDVMLKEWSNRGINLWALQKVETALDSGESEIGLRSYDVDVIDAYISDSSTGTDYPVERITRGDYNALPQKDSTGRPFNLYVERTIPGRMYLWPVPNTSNYTLVTHRLTAIEDSGKYSDTIQVPQRFIPAMVAGLTYYLSMKTARDLTQIVKMEYDEELARAINEDTERGSLYIRPMRY